MAKTSIRRLFFNYLIYIILWLTGGVVMMFILFQLLLNAGFILPANANQTRVPKVLVELKEAPIFSDELIPTTYQFSLRDENGQELAANLPVNKQNSLIRLTSSQPTSIGFQKVGERHTTKFGTLYIGYSLTADFAMPTLQKWLPKAEWLYYLISFILIVLGFLWISSRFGQRINHELTKLIRITNEIGAMNLAYDHEQSNILEIDGVFKSVYKMEDNLTQALEEQWRTEKESQEMLQALAHDIKTPVTVIGGNLELLKETQMEPNQLTYVEYAESHLARMDYYIKELTDLAELEGKEKLSKQVMKVANLFANLTKLGVGLVPDLRVVNQLTPDQKEREITINEEGLYRGLQNVLLNAQEYSPNPGSIVLTFKISEEMLAIVVNDNGAGFTPEAIARGKELFFSTQASRTGGKHYGMGLAITNKNLKSQGGYLKLANTFENGGISGAKVCLNLPFLIA